ncbi:UNVERIFIED_CONTAM: putative ribonuclease H protein [Sesamum angustifolium]|uniref:Ribonuclease H protein n=1 Tax=Sesamum angustifolium TaxID=2727405 RepID=A0AAW2JMG5_9LAMI
MSFWPKAFDRVNWEFLYQVLQRKGFPQRWIGFVANAISHCWFSVLVNGEHAGFFHSTRGLRQGDPLSPALFVLAADYLSRGLERLFAAHPTLFYQTPSLIRVSHLAYADDLMIFTTPCRQNMELLRDFLRAYERVSGQLINGSKFLYCGLPGFLPTDAGSAGCVGYQLKHLPITYLGVPLYKGNRKACLFNPIISRLRDLLQGWAMTNLSHGGRLALIRSVLQTTPLHLLQGKSSLWSEYLHGRYCQNLHPTIVTYNRNHSSVWHRLCRIRDVAEPFIFWTLGEVGQVDRIVWTKSSTGEFSTKSAWETIRQASPRRQLLADVWHRSLRPTISVFLWPLFKIKSQWTRECNKIGSVFHLNVSAVRQRRQFPICSLTAQQCRAYGSTLLRYSTPFHSDLHIRTLTPFLILWFTWTQRNAAKYRGQVPRAPSIVRWHAPSPSWFKLNTDGSSLGNPGLAGAAGIIRDSAGHDHLAYQFALGTGTSVLTELTAVSRGWSFP